MSNHYIDFDPASFDPWRAQEVTHRLADHPLLRIDSLVELGRPLQSRKHVRTHNADALASTSFAYAPDLHPNRKSAPETLAQLAQANAWMSLLFVHMDEVYRPFIDDIFAELSPLLAQRDPGMSYR